MEERSESTTRYWCHICSREVETLTELDNTIKCSLCNGGFVEEYDTAIIDYHNHNHHHHHHHHHHHQNLNQLALGDSESDRALSLWGPILLRMLSSNPRRRRRSRQIENADDHHNDSSSELDRELEFVRRRRRQNSATVVQLLQGLRAGMITQFENINNETGGDQNIHNRERDQLILINPYTNNNNNNNNTIIFQGSGGLGGSTFDSGGPQNHPIGSSLLGDYFVGPGLELLLQHLAENDPNRYGTPPAKKEAVEEMPDVKIEEEESFQCSVCLDDFEIGVEAKEMPCKHRFHGDCILPWLQIHSSCPVCRFQLPSDESKLLAGESEIIAGGDDRRLSVALPWPFNNLLSSSTSATQITNTNTNPHLIMNTTESGSGPPPESGEGGGGGRRDDGDQ